MDPLCGWPEPVVPVQSISDSYPSAIRSPSQRPSPATALLAIPVVDLATSPDLATAQAVFAACRDWGFFQIVNHDVSPRLLRRAREVWRGFFALSMAEKLRYANTPTTYEGYGSRLGVQKGAILDWGDYYFLHLLPLQLKDPGKWPALPADCQDVVEEYDREVMSLCEALMRVLSLGLGLEDGRLRKEALWRLGASCVRVSPVRERRIGHEVEGERIASGTGG